MKKTISLILVIGLLFSLVVGMQITTQGEAKTEFTSADLLAIKKHLLGITLLNNEQQEPYKFCNFNGIGAADLLFMKKILLNIVEYPIMLPDSYEILKRDEMPEGRKLDLPVAEKIQPFGFSTTDEWENKIYDELGLSVFGNIYSYGIHNIMIINSVSEFIKKIHTDINETKYNENYFKNNAIIFIVSWFPMSPNKTEKGLIIKNKNELIFELFVTFWGGNFVPDASFNIFEIKKSELISVNKLSFYFQEYLGDW